MIRAIKKDQKTACVSLSHRPQLDCTITLSWLRSLRVVAGVCDWLRGVRQRRSRGRDMRASTLNQSALLYRLGPHCNLVEATRLMPSNAKTR